MTTINDYRVFVNRLNALDASLNLFDACTTNLVNSGVLSVDTSTGSYFMVNPNAGICSVTNGSISYDSLKTQINAAIVDLSGTIITLNQNITNGNYTTTSTRITELKQMYNNMLDKRRKLDYKMQELYANSRSGNDMQIQTDSAVYGALLWTVLATSLVYYVFIKL